MTETAFVIKGMYRDVLVRDGARIVYDSGWVPNTIVNGCRMLLAAFMKNESPRGIQKLFVGQGDPAWDTAAAPPAPDTAGLVNPFATPITDPKVVFVDPLTNTEVTGPTTRLEVTVTLPPSFPGLAPNAFYPLREFGLFGVYKRAVSDPETPFMINCVRHPVIYKDGASTLLRTIRLSF